MGKKNISKFDEILCSKLCLYFAAYGIHLGIDGTAGTTFVHSYTLLPIRKRFKLKIGAFLLENLIIRITELWKT
jgi:hypothetical protein